MPQSSVITQEMRNSVGVDSEPMTHTVELGAVRKFAQAIGDPNPLYYDEERSRRTRYGGIIAPPTFLRSFSPWPSSVAFRSPYPDLLDGGSEWEFFGPPVRPGDRITVTTRIVDLRERTGQLGDMLFVTSETRHANQSGAVVAVEQNTLIYYPASGEP